MCRLLSLAYPGDKSPTVEFIGRDCFLDSLGANNFKVRILDQRVLTLDSAYDLVAQMSCYSNNSETRPADKWNSLREDDRRIRQVNVAHSDVLNERLEQQTQIMAILLQWIEQFTAELRATQPFTPRPRETYGAPTTSNT